MNIYKYFQELINNSLKEMVVGQLAPEAVIDPAMLARITVEPPRDAAHGDIATNAALILAKPAGLNPRAFAESLSAALKKAEPHIDNVDVAGPGFINLRLSSAFWQARIPEILGSGIAYGDSDFGGGEKVNVEFVSANPTGPLHIGHVRGAVFGDALAKIFKKTGYDVTTEYYINDAGSQIDTLARSAHLRYREALGEAIGEIPEGLYPGDYLIPVGKALAEEFGHKFVNAGESDWLELFKKRAVAAMMALIKSDLQLLSIEQDIFFSENALHETGGVKAAVDYMDQKGLMYQGVLEPPKGKAPDDWEPRPQTLFKATEFGDDVDRPIKKSDGSFTYFAADIAYHYDKIKRGYAQLVNVFGADHGGYVKRLKAVVQALSDGKTALDIKLCQMVRLFKGGAPYKMSKRAGSFVTLRELVSDVGPDVVRFIMLFRKNEAPLDFDFTAVTEQSKDNPVFYVQYAHARVHSVLSKLAELDPSADLSHSALAKADVSLLSHEAEIALIRSMTAWPRLLESAAQSHEPHKVAFYLYDLASEFHSLWNLGNTEQAVRFVQEDDPKGNLARMALLVAFSQVIASGLTLMGVTPLKEMR